MSNADEEKEREERALDALIASAFKEDVCDVNDEEMERFGQMIPEADRVALDIALGPNFIESLFAGDAGPKSQKNVRGQLSTAMNRSEEEKPPTEAAQEEMNRKMREADEKRKAREEGGQDGADAGR